MTEVIIEQPVDLGSGLDTDVLFRAIQQGLVLPDLGGSTVRFQSSLIRHEAKLRVMAFLVSNPAGHVLWSHRMIYGFDGTREWADVACEVVREINFNLMQDVGRIREMKAASAGVRAAW